MNVPTFVTVALTGKKLNSIEEGRKLYAGKAFFIKNTDGTLDGPRDDIYYSVRYYSGLKERIKALYHKVTGVKPYVFVQISSGIPKRAFTEDEIVVKQDNG